MNKLKFFFTIVFTFMLLSNPVIAGGLADATTEVTEIQTWLYGISFIFCLIFMIYQIGMAMMDKQQWADVLTAFGKVAIAGGAVVGATWAWGIWGT
ncbi:hypothetical protein [uncultured Shewanella sp.]|uniref:hypothetical protein n=1 Tax=uncultured Shewanella sp. TaxID=173975 RepID=UPI0026238B12|nr:hypothetical protein [uncultured Shewanella sp.]